MYKKRIEIVISNIKLFQQYTFNFFKTISNSILLLVFSDSEPKLVHFIRGKTNTFMKRQKASVKSMQPPRIQKHCRKHCLSLMILIHLTLSGHPIRQTSIYHRCHRVHFNFDLMNLKILP